MSRIENIESMDWAQITVFTPVHVMTMDRATPIASLIGLVMGTDGAFVVVRTRKLWPVGAHGSAVSMGVDMRIALANIAGWVPVKEPQ